METTQVLRIPEVLAQKETRGCRIWHPASSKAGGSPYHRSGTLRSPLRSRGIRRSSLRHVSWAGGRQPPPSLRLRIDKGLFTRDNVFSDGSIGSDRRCTQGWQEPVLGTLFEFLHRSILKQDPEFRFVKQLVLVQIVKLGGFKTPISL